MDQDLQNRLEEYLRLLADLSQKTGDARTALSLLQELSKDRRMEQIRQEQRARRGGPITTTYAKF